MKGGSGSGARWQMRTACRRVERDLQEQPLVAHEEVRVRVCRVLVQAEALKVVFSAGGSGGGGQVVGVWRLAASVEAPKRGR